MTKQSDLLAHADRLFEGVVVDFSVDPVAHSALGLLNHLCPLCGAPISWSCHGSNDGDEGHATCTLSPIASRLPGAAGWCPWVGSVHRKGSGVVLGATDEERTETMRQHIAEGRANGMLK